MRQTPSPSPLTSPNDKRLSKGHFMLTGSDRDFPPEIVVMTDVIQAARRVVANPDDVGLDELRAALKAFDELSTGAGDPE
jgi:hypothetical protein